VATPKRQRQDERRTVKAQEQAAVAAKEAKVKKRNRLLWYVLPGLVVIAALVFWPRSNKDTKEVTASSDVSVSTVPASTTTVPAVLKTKPEFTIPDGTPPAELQIKDLVVGTGPAAVKGSGLVVNYVGKSWSTKKEFDTSWGKSPYPVVGLGNGGVIQGWGEGLIGMKQGGRRQLTIPPAKGYGNQGAGVDIKPGETLVFVIDALEVTPPAAG
jgi:peptidylprolyl isomerase